MPTHVILNVKPFFRFDNLPKCFRHRAQERDKERFLPGLATRGVHHELSL